MRWLKQAPSAAAAQTESRRARFMRDRAKIIAASIVCLAAAGGALANSQGTFGAFTASVNNTTNTVATSIYSCRPQLQDSRGIIGLDTLNATQASGIPNLGSYADAATMNSGLLTSITVNQGLGPCPRDYGYLTFNNGTVPGAIAGAAFALYSPTTRIPRTVLASNTTQILWFRTSAVRSGTLMMIGTQFSTSANSATITGQRDHVIALTSTGRVAFGVFNYSVNPIISPASYTDGNWHQVIATASTTSGVTLYVDGVQVAANSATRPQLSEWAASSSPSGYLYLGYHSIGTWGFPVNTWGYTGDMTMPVVLTSALTSAEAAQWYARSLM